MSPRRLFGKHLTADERRLALRIAVVFAIPMALIMLVPLIGAFLWARDIQADQIQRNQENIARIEAERIERTQALNDFVFRLCIADEVKDVVVVEQLEEAKRRARASLPPGPDLSRAIEKIDEGIFALEPPNEPDCNPPAAQSP